MDYTIKFTSSVDNYDTIITKLSQMLQENGFVLVKNTRHTPCYNTNYRHIEQVLGDLKYSELKEYESLLGKILNTED